MRGPLDHFLSFYEDFKKVTLLTFGKTTTHKVRLAFEKFFWDKGQMLYRGWAEDAG